MKPFNGGPRKQRGIALIIAMILVVLATILASKLTFDGFLEQRRTVGVRHPGGQRVHKLLRHRHQLRPGAVVRHRDDTIPDLRRSQ